MKKPPPLAFDLKFMGCSYNHLHVVLLDEGKREIGEFVINDMVAFYSFMMAIGKAADDAFEVTETLQ